VRSLYEQHARPLTRIVHGLPTSWEPSIAATKFPSPIDTAAWSPCSGFIAVAWGKSTAKIEILDAVTLQRVAVPEFPLGGTRWLVFSPDSRLLTWFGDDPGKFLSWNHQTGVLVSAIHPERSIRSMHCLSATYSTSGTMFGVSFLNRRTFTVSIYHVFSGNHVGSCSVEEPTLHNIWTHGECLRFATMEQGYITVQQIGFTQPDTITAIELLQTPSDSHRSGNFFLPNPPRLAFITGGRIKVWDAKNSKFLLDSADVEFPRRVSFSLDGHFFACGTNGPESYLWEASPTGYILHRKLISNTSTSEPHISPNGRSIIVLGDSAVQLLRTTDSTTSPPAVSARASQRGKGRFILGFSPGEVLAAVAWMEEETVTVLDLKSGIPRLIIGAGMKVYALGLGRTTIVIVGEGKIVTWNLPAENHGLDHRVNMDDSILSTTFDHPPFPVLEPRPTTSVSPDLCRIAIVGLDKHRRAGSRLYLYDVPTGRQLDSVSTGLEASPWFTPDGNEVWCVTDHGEANMWNIVEDGKSGLTELQYLGSTTYIPDGYPWRPSRGYMIPDGRWVVKSDGTRLLWLPPRWRSYRWDLMWGGRFLALLDCELPEPIILEL